MSELGDLYSAIEGNDIDALERLLVIDKELADSKELTPPPLHFAVLMDQPRIVEAMLDHGADIESQDQDRNTTPVRYAIVYDRREIIRILIARGADLGVVEGLDMSALQVAEEGAAGGFEEFEELPSRAQYGEIVDLLKEFGAKPDATGKTGSLNM